MKHVTHKKGLKIIVIVIPKEGLAGLVIVVPSLNEVEEEGLY